MLLWLVARDSRGGSSFAACRRDGLARDLRWYIEHKEDKINVHGRMFAHKQWVYMISSSVISPPKSLAEGSSGTLVSRDPLDTERRPEELWDIREAADEEAGTSGSDGAGALWRRVTRVMVVRGFASCGTATDL